MAMTWSTAGVHTHKDGHIMGDRNKEPQLVTVIENGLTNFVEESYRGQGRK